MLPDYVHGVSVDAYGYVWAVSMTQVAFRVDPDSRDYTWFDGLVEPYTYSDMTGQALLSVRDRDKPGCLKLANILIERGFDIVATDGTARYLADNGISCRRVNKVREGRPHIVDMIKNGEIAFITNTTEGKKAIRESESIRGAAVQNKVTYYTTLAAAMATSMALDHVEGGDVNKLQDLHAESESPE